MRDAFLFIIIIDYFILVMNNSDDERPSWWLFSPPNDTKRLKLYLEKLSLYDHQRKIAKTEDKKKLAIPLKYDEFREILKHDDGFKSFLEHSNTTLEHKAIPAQKSCKLNPKDNLCKCIRELFIQKGLTFNDDLCKDLPNHWEKHGDLVLLSEQCFQSEEWKKLGNELWTVTAKALDAKRLGKKSVIREDGYRTPSVCLFTGADGWVSHIDNGITYTYDVTKCMFSSGNITEKIRVGKFDCHEQTVVDLYAGIGYFVLPYLVHAGASTVYACEWNPDAVLALKRNLVLNRVEKRCIVVEGDNQMFPYQGIADHVNLGLIPSSEEGWPVACRALHPHGGWLHVHGNVTSTTHRIKDQTVQKVKPEWKEWSKYVAEKITELLLKKKPGKTIKWLVNVSHIEHVKSYAPHVDHLVLDIECRPLLENENC